MNLDNQNEEDHKSIMSSHQQLLWKIVSSLERIETTLIGNAFNNNRGLVHKVESHGETIESINKRVTTLETSLDNDEDSEKKNHSLWALAATWIAAIAAVVAALFAYSPKK